MQYLSAQLERDVYFFKMFANTKGKRSKDYKISQCDYERVSIEMIKHHSNNEQTLEGKSVNLLH